jgi:uncharacterized protein (TIGR03435 family)
MKLRALSIAILLTAITGPIAFGQNEAVSPVKSTVRSSAKGQSFEVASVRLSPPGGNGMASVSDWGTPRFTAKNATFLLLLEIAFGVDDGQIVGAPKWLESQLYDVDAKAEGDAGLSYEQMQPLIQQLLKERFHLAVHRETKDVPGYALVLAKDGPKLHAATGGPAYGQIMSDRLICPGCTVATLSGMLTRVTKRPVVDKSEIKGAYDIQLSYAPLNASDSPSAADSPLPSLLTALQEQAGLKLTPQKVPLEMLVIDHVERDPTDN